MNIHDVTGGGVGAFGNAVSHSTPGGSYRVFVCDVHANIRNTDKEV